MDRVGVPGKPASPGERVLAVVIDSLVQALLVAPVVAALGFVWLSGALQGETSQSPTGTAALLGGAVVAPFVALGYHTVLEGRYGQTLGKRVLGIRVVADGGTPPDWQAVLLRNYVRLIDVLPLGYVVGGCVLWWDRGNRRLGDLIADTRVVSDDGATGNASKDRDTRLNEPTPPDDPDADGTVPIDSD